MKKFTINKLEREEPELAKKAVYGFNLVVPEIASMVVDSLRTTPPGTIAVHATFIKVTNDETDEVIYIELDMEFLKVYEGKIESMLSEVVLYEHEEEYETRRVEMIKKTVRDNGNEMYPVYKKIDAFLN